MRKKKGISLDADDSVNSGLQNNVDFIDLASFIKSDLNDYSTKHFGFKCTIKYLDPKITIMSAPAIAQDVNMCHTLANAAVHSMMAGFSEFSAAIVRGDSVMIPWRLLERSEPRKMKRKDPDWQRLLGSTGQRNFLSPEN